MNEEVTSYSTSSKATGRLIPLTEWLYFYPEICVVFKQNYPEIYVEYNRFYPEIYVIFYINYPWFYVNLHIISLLQHEKETI